MVVAGEAKDSEAAEVVVIVVAIEVPTMEVLPVIMAVLTLEA